MPEERDAQPQHGRAHGREKADKAEDVDPDLLALGKAAGQHIDAHMFALQQRIAGRQQEGCGKQVPLHFEIGVGAGVEHLAHHRVHAADDGGAQDEPDDVLADLGVKPVDPSRKFQ
ncbi:hypothetical protein D3C86_1800130 [compost metagenome]